MQWNVGKWASKPLKIGQTNVSSTDVGSTTNTVYGKPLRKVSPILVTLTSRSDSDSECSNVSLKENKPDGVNPNSNDIEYYIRKNEGKLYGFRQTEHLGLFSTR